MITLKEFRGIFQKQFPEAKALSYDIYSEKSDFEVILGNKRVFIFSLQARINQETSLNFAHKLESTIDKKGCFFVPIFLGGDESEFVFKYKNLLERIANCKEKTNDVKGVQKRVKYVSRQQNGRIVLFNPSYLSIPVFEIWQTFPAHAKTELPLMGLPPGTSKSDVKYESTEIEEGLHFREVNRIGYGVAKIVGGSKIFRKNNEASQLKLF